MSEPERIDVRAGGLDFAALAWGDERDPLALLLHGFPDSPWTWRRLGPRLAARGRRVVAPWMRGYGPTGPAPGDSYRVADLAEDACALADALGAGPDAALIGHDWGAVAAWVVSARAPGRFAQLAALSVPPPSVLLRLWTSPAGVPLGLRQARRSWYFAYVQVPGVENRLPALTERLWREWSPGYDAGEDLPRVHEALATRAQRRAALAYYRQNLRGGLAQLGAARPRQRVAYLHGAADGCVLPAVAARASAAMVPGAGHFVALENPAGVGALLTL